MPNGTTNMFRLAQDGKTIVPVTCGTHFFNPDALRTLFENLSDGKTPNFLEMIAALSDVSVLMTPPGNCPDCHMSLND